MKPDISILIVVYQVRGFISFCLHSIERAKLNYNIEIIFIDNGADTYLKQLLQDNYSEVKYIENTENLGFAKACNQGARLAKGKYLFFLNPDTLVSENLFTDLIENVASIENLGLLTVPLIDGKGDYLPETARYIPTFSSAMYKVIGLNRGYYMPIKGEMIQEVEAICGAFAFCKKEVFDQVGGFDERFFMYAEDIDLSKRFLEAGYKNYLLNLSKVIHFKGESTEKNKWSYNYNFYDSMYRYIKKNIGSGYSRYQAVLVRIASLILSFLSLFWMAAKSAFRPVVDMLLSLFVVVLWSKFYSKIQYGVWDYYDLVNVCLNGLLYGLCWIGIGFAAGNYIATNKPSFVGKSLLLGVILSLVLYALLPLDLRFSRAVLVLSGASIICIMMLRSSLVWNNLKSRNVTVIAENITTKEEQFLQRYVAPTPTFLAHSSSNPSSQINSSRVVWDIENNGDIISLIQNRFSNLTLWDRKEGLLMSSANPNTQGIRFNALSHHNLAKATFRHQKRCIDIVIGILIFIPLCISQLIQFKISGLGNWKKLMMGKRTSIGYSSSAFPKLSQLNSVIMEVYTNGDNELIKNEKSLRYSMHYSTLDDVMIIMNRFMEFVKAF